MKLAINAVQQMVVSRFPLVTDNQCIVIFNLTSEFGARDDAVLAAYLFSTPQ